MNRYWFFTLVFLVISGTTFSQSQDSAIQVTGVGKVQVKPDQLKFNVVIREQGALLSKTGKLVDVKTKQVIDALTANRVPLDNIQSLNVSVQPWTERNNSTVMQKGFIVSRDIFVTLSDYDELETIVDRIYRIGVGYINGFQHSVSDYDKKYQQAMLLAVEDAQMKASILAKASNVKLGSVVMVNEVSSPITPMYSRQSFAAHPETGTIYAPGSTEISATLQVLFTIE